MAHQIWYDPPFSQRIKLLKIAVEVKVRGNEKNGLKKFFKRLGRQYRQGGSS